MILFFEGKRLTKYRNDQCEKVTAPLVKRFKKLPNCTDQSGKVYQAVCKAVRLHTLHRNICRSTVEDIIYKWKRTETIVNLARSVQPYKISLIPWR